MDWYYSVGGEQKGPVGEEEFQRLVQEGVITNQTLVWRNGMAQWQPFSGAASASSAPDQAPAAGIICGGCGMSFSSGEVVSLEGRAYCAACKPLALQRMREGVSSNSEAEETRKRYLNHESSVRSIGVLYILGGLAVALVGVVSIFASGGDLVRAVPSLLLLVLAAGQFWVGLGIRKLRQWSRIPTGILSGIGLLGFPIGTLINGYILYLVFSEKGKMVFSDEYLAIVQQTPHIKQRTSVVVWIILGLLLAIIGIGILAAIFGSRR